MRHRTWFAVVSCVALASAGQLVVTGPSASAADAVDPTRAQPIAIPADVTSCAGVRSDVPLPIAVSITIPAGKACPKATGWLRWDARPQAAADRQLLVDSIVDPKSPDLSQASWQQSLAAGSVPLADAEEALNAWSGKVIFLPLFDDARGSGERLEYRVTTVVPFRLERAYLMKPDEVCGGDQVETCLLGTILESDAAATPTPEPTPRPTAKPKHSQAPEPTAIASVDPSTAPDPPGSPSASPAGSPEPVGSSGELPPPSADPTGSPIPAGSSEQGGSPAPSGSSSPIPGSSLSPLPSSSIEEGALPFLSKGLVGPRFATVASSTDPYLALDVPSEVAIPLERGSANVVDVPVNITSNEPWSVCVSDPSGVGSRGHMIGGSPSTPLAEVMRASEGDGPTLDLDGSDCVVVLAGSGSTSSTIRLHQAVRPGDRPGAYHIGLVFQAIFGF